MTVAGDTEPKEPFRVLSIDGGGIRGYYTAILLRGLATEFGRQQGLPDGQEIDLGRRFHMIVGTSTGAIIAAALAAGVPLSRVIALYKGKAAEIFQNPVPSNGASKLKFLLWAVLRFKSAANDPSVLLKALEDEFKNETIGQVYSRRGIALCIPSIDAQTQRAWVFKTPHNIRLQRDVHYRLADVCAASGAAPLVFPLKKITRPTGPLPESSTPDARKSAQSSSDHIDSTQATELQHDAPRVDWFVDGGLWANNPSLVALTEALTVAEPGRTIQLVSASTCPPFKGASVNDKSSDRGLVGWKGGIKMVETALDSQAYAYDFMTQRVAEHANRPVQYVRLSDPPIGIDDVPYLGLDNPSKDALDRLATLAHRAVDLNRSESTAGAKPGKAVLQDVFSNLQIMERETAK
jgi:uncharacterized protein